MKIFLYISVLMFVSCKKTEVAQPPSLTASYKVIVTTKWSAPAFSVPAGAHLTTLVGIVHSSDTFLWSNKPASTGLKFVAEVGSNWRLMNELDTFIMRNKALSQFAIAPPVINSAVEFSIDVTTTFPSVSFASMIAPSPDWFTGINNFNLLQNNKWLNDISLDMPLYDAGSEEGDIFGYANPATIPARNVSLLTAANATVLANGNPALAGIATIRFIKN